MQALKIIVYVIGLYFAGSWTLGIWGNPQYRLKGTVVGIIFWWVEILLAFTGVISVLHLIWLMPLTLGCSTRLMHSELQITGQATFGRILITTALFVSIFIGLIVYFQ